MKFVTDEEDGKRRMSPPMWGCGLKSSVQMPLALPLCVTPYVGVWIEIPAMNVSGVFLDVTPYVGVWIEIE